MMMENQKQPSWGSCPTCNRPMPPGKQLCVSCLVQREMDNGVAHAKAGRYAEALQCFKVILEQDEEGVDKAQAYYLSGAALIKSGKTAKAEKAFWKCLEIDPGHPKARKKLVQQIIEKPKKEWTPEEKTLVEGSEFSVPKTKPEKKKKEKKKNTARFNWVPWAIGLFVILVTGGIVVWGGWSAYNYFTFQRHIEDISHEAYLGRPRSAMEKFNNIFGSTEAAVHRQKAMSVLAPRFREAAENFKDDSKIHEELSKAAESFESSS
jgi:tetratricopeptide (TPR) repeat protein